MTCGDDVAKGIASIVGKENALGEIFHITYRESLRWKDVLGIYQNVLTNHLGREVPVIYTDKSTNLRFKERVYQLVYCRYFNRTFDNRRIGEFCNIYDFTAPNIGLANALTEFLKSPKFSNIPWDIEAVNDRVAGEFTPLSEIPRLGNKISYLLYRFNLAFLYRSLVNIYSRVKTLKHTFI